MVTPSIHAVSRDGARFIVVVIAVAGVFKEQLERVIKATFDKLTNFIGK